MEGGGDLFQKAFPAFEPKRISLRWAGAATRPLLIPGSVEQVSGFRQIGEQISDANDEESDQWLFKKKKKSKLPAEKQAGGEGGYAHRGFASHLWLPPTISVLKENLRDYFLEDGAWNYH